MIVKGLAALALLVSAANAAIIFQAGNNPQPNEVNVNLNPGTGFTVTGVLPGFPMTTVEFTSTQELNAQPSGQAFVEANDTQGQDDTPLTNVAVSLTNGWVFEDIIFNLRQIGQNAGTGGPATITVNGTVSGPQVFTPTLDDNGQNFFTIYATGESISSVSILAAGGFSDISQVRISGPMDENGGGGSEIPEPSTFALLGGSLALIGIVRRMRS